MKKASMAIIVATYATLMGCKLIVEVPFGGSVVSESGDFSCGANKHCEIEIRNFDFDEKFEAIPDPGWQFVAWQRRQSLCGGGRCQPHMDSHFEDNIYFT